MIVDYIAAEGGLNGGDGMLSASQRDYLAIFAAWRLLWWLCRTLDFHFIQPGALEQATDVTMDALPHLIRIYSLCGAQPYP